MNRVRHFLTSGFLLATLVAALPVHTFAVRHGGNRCTDRCADAYRVKKDACGLIPFKHERKICERRAKEAKNDCKHHCH